MKGKWFCYLVLRVWINLDLYFPVLGSVEQIHTTVCSGSSVDRREARVCCLGDVTRKGFCFTEAFVEGCFLRSINCWWVKGMLCPVDWVSLTVCCIYIALALALWYYFDCYSRSLCTCLTSKLDNVIVITSISLVCHLLASIFKIEISNFKFQISTILIVLNVLFRSRGIMRIIKLSINQKKVSVKYKHMIDYSYKPNY